MSDQKLELDSGGGTGFVYYVEARTTVKILDGEFQTLAGMTIGPTWRRLSFSHSVIGVPVPLAHMPPGSAERGYLTLEAAIALAAWARASIDPKLHCHVIGVQTRIVEVEWKYSYAGKIAAFSPEDNSSPSSARWQKAEAPVVQP